MTTIGFFGDSFCAMLENEHSISNGYETWLKKLVNHYNAEVVHLGNPGGNVWDTILLQFKPFIENPPDIIVFTWTSVGGIFHRENRNLHYPRVSDKNTDPLMIAAKYYFEYLFDEEKMNTELSAALMYFDETVLSKLKKSKIVHLWCYGNTHYNTVILEGNPYDSVISYHHTWRHGVEIRPALMSYAYETHYGKTIIEVLKKDTRPNHIGTEELNQKIFNLVKSAIDEPVP